MVHHRVMRDGRHAYDRLPLAQGVQCALVGIRACNPVRRGSQWTPCLLAVVSASCCRHRRLFRSAMMPDTSFCTCAPLSCAATLMQVGEGAAFLLNALEPPPSMAYSLDTRAPPIRVRMLAELIHGGGCDAANACDANTTGSGCEVDYPFETTGGNLSSMRSAAWEGVTLAATEISSEQDVHPVSLVGVVASTNSTSNRGVGGFDPVNGFDSLGAAVIHFDSDPDSQDDEMDVGLNAQRLAHELGHCFGLQHDDAIATPAGYVAPTNGFMHGEFPGPVPILGGNESGTDFLPGTSN